MEFGQVWTPIIDPAWLTGTTPSFLLLQSIFVAASRMTTQPNEYGLSSDFYRRAKLLFFFGVERDPLISVTSAILLHWYNPVGPETVSTDTGGFWLRAAESIAFQIGLHKEPSVKDRQRGLRRRLWWTLVVSGPKLLVEYCADYLATRLHHLRRHRAPPDNQPERQRRTASLCRRLRRTRRPRPPLPRLRLHLPATRRHRRALSPPRTHPRQPAKPRELTVPLVQAGLPRRRRPVPRVHHGSASSARYVPR